MAETKKRKRTTKNNKNGEKTKKVDNEIEEIKEEIEMQRGFDPVIGKDPHTLILGMFPSKKSRSIAEYYGMPSNIFWDIVGTALGFVRKTTPYDTRKKYLTEAGYALWDVHLSARTNGSLDKELHDCSSADVRQLVTSNPTIKRIVFNSRQAAVDFIKYYSHWLLEKPCMFKFANDFAKDKFKKFVVDDSLLSVHHISILIMESTSGTHTIKRNKIMYKICTMDARMFQQDSVYYPRLKNCKLYKFSNKTPEFSN